MGRHGNEISLPLDRLAGRVVGRTSRYLLQSDDPASLLQLHGMTHLLYNHMRFGEQGRAMVVRLLDGDGRFAWSAGINGDGKTLVRARLDLVGCGPIFYGGPVFYSDNQVHRLPSAPGGANGPRCPVQRYKGPRSAARSATTVLR